jgi:hypothetical protein
VFWAAFGESEDTDRHETDQSEDHL